MGEIHSGVDSGPSIRRPLALFGVEPSRRGGIIDSQRVINIVFTPRVMPYVAWLNRRAGYLQDHTAGGVLHEL